MDRETVAVYDANAATYHRNRSAADTERVASLTALLDDDDRIVDLGCGPGLNLDQLGAHRTVALDAARAMLAEIPPDQRRLAVQADLAAVPLRRGSVQAVWANKSLQHVDAATLPMALAGLHHSLSVGGQLELLAFTGEGEWRSDDDLPGRRFTLWSPEAWLDLLMGAGFEVDQVDERTAPPGQHWPAGMIRLRATRARTLPDTVGPGMDLLVCGLNPSCYAADAGAGFARPGNRFWPALTAAGLSDEATDRAPARLLAVRHIGMTDLVKRASVGAAELSTAEYRSGLARVERLCGRLQPRAVCFVGLAGWRAAADRKAVAGWQPRELAGVPVYVMPSTSGLNARTSLEVFTDHLKAAISVTRRSRRPGAHR
ncbi:MAG TPA: uracil-DNA glycosylase family protein [Acidimicrobiales bacterium]|jgi:TDG/mug DNA glycosylase family protein|nr:uracil-DNA glycosylase family protein [Acidimicrobiales bacterium]